MLNGENAIDVLNPTTRAIRLLTLSELDLIGGGAQDIAYRGGSF